MVNQQLNIHYQIIIKKQKQTNKKLSYRFKHPSLLSEKDNDVQEQGEI